MIHRDANGFTRHYVGAGLSGGRARRNPGGPMYLYHGARHTPFWAAPYRWPKGEHPRHFHRHDRFPVIFLIPEYFVDDYDDFDLSAPPSNAQWVRYGDDLVLVDVDTGEILQVVEGVFTEQPDDAVTPEDVGPADDGSTPPDADQAPPN
ncbi:MAG TPA: RcnB family protein [Caulobacteraceae bacterium]|nr:RcnB family protein [Caulobacteraceae bacterium]